MKKLDDDILVNEQSIQTQKQALETLKSRRKA
jgi:hypothetical protein